MTLFSENSVVVVLVIVCVGVVMIKLAKFLQTRNLYKKKVQEKQAQVKANHEMIRKVVFADADIEQMSEEITSLAVVQLLDKLQKGELSCVQVLKAYQAKAFLITEDLNCITEFIKEADEWAKQLDSESALSGKKGILHGLPFSVKDNVSIVGYDATAGLSYHLNKPAVEDAALVIALKSLGAIPFCRTNVPQTMLSVGCSNPIWGSTGNPFCKKRTPGGSSGGEACLIGAGGSPLGIGSDIGGSVRIPAAHCGIYSLKPTYNRLSYKGFKKSAVGCIGLAAVPGILTRDPKLLVMVTKLLLEDGYLQRSFDQDVLPIPWNELAFTITRKLRIGFYDEFEYFPTTPGVRRAVQITKTKLEALGHELIPFAPTNVDFAINSHINMLNADEGRYLLETIGADDIDPIMRLHLVVALRLPHILKRVAEPILNLVAPSLTPCFMAGRGHSYRRTHQLWEGFAKQSDYKNKFLDRWRQLGLDLCIGPCYACPAPLRQDVGRIVPAFSYACLYNYIDLPAGVVPVTKETEEDQTNLLNGGYDRRDMVCKVVKKNTIGAIGMPIPVQVIGLPYQEELVLHGMRIIDSLFREQ